MEDRQNWLCKLCTNVNATNHVTCSICGVPRSSEDEASSTVAFSQNQISSARPKKIKGRQRRKQIDPEQQQQRLLEFADNHAPVAQLSGAAAPEYNPPTRRPRSPSRRAISTIAPRPNRSELSAADKYDIVDQEAEAYSPSSASQGRHYVELSDNTKPRASTPSREFTSQQQHIDRSNSAGMADDHQSMPTDEKDSSSDGGNKTTEEKSTLVAAEDPGPESEFRRSYYKAKSSTRRTSQRSGNDLDEDSEDASIVQNDHRKDHSYSSDDEDDDSMTDRTEDSYDTFSTYSSFGMSASFDQNNETAIEAVRLERLARLLSPSWFGKYDFSPAYAQRLVSFKYAQQKRREVYGFESPWGIMGLYEHLSAIRNDIKWADEVERRKEYGLP
jgi:hypothetical protein